MGFSPAAVRKLVFKVQAANVIDASTGAFWYQSVLENTPKIDPARILDQFGVVSSNAPTDQADLINNLIPGVLNGIVEDLRGAAIPNPPTTFTQLH